MSQKAYERLFKDKCEFALGVSDISGLPASNLPEIAFVGRSNVGKSSLVNAVTGKTAIARVSNTPGRTRELNFFNLSDIFFLVDLPGYGYAKVARTQSEKWNILLRKYLKGRQQLKRVFILVDSRHGLKESDFEMMEMLDIAAVSYQLILTKMDKLGKGELAEVQEATLNAVKSRPASYPEIICTSSEKNIGIDELRKIIAGLVKE
jgi:GTP-binding protein